VLLQLFWYVTEHLISGCVSDWELQFFFMPDSPISVKWLNDRERAIAVQRVADHQLGVKNSKYGWYKNALTPLLTQVSTYRSPEVEPSKL
jgi:hypothetical protein